MAASKHGTPLLANWFSNESEKSRVSSPGIEPGPRPSQSRVRSGTLQGHVVQQPAEESNPVLQNRSLPCNPAHSQAVLLAARPGIEPGPTASEADMLSGTPTGHIVIEGHYVRSTQPSRLASTLITTLVSKSTPTWTRTRTKTLGGSRAVHYTIGTQEPTTGLAPASFRLQGGRLSESSHVGILSISQRVTEGS